MIALQQFLQLRPCCGPGPGPFWLACEQALCLEKKKIERKGKRNGGREPVDKHLRPQFRPLVIILPNICQ